MHLLLPVSARAKMCCLVLSGSSVVSSAVFSNYSSPVSVLGLGNLGEWLLSNFFWVICFFQHLPINILVVFSVLSLFHTVSSFSVRISVFNQMWSLQNLSSTASLQGKRSHVNPLANLLFIYILPLLGIHKFIIWWITNHMIQPHAEPEPPPNVQRGSSPRRWSPTSPALNAQLLTFDTSRAVSVALLLLLGSKLRHGSGEADTSVLLEPRSCLASAPHTIQITVWDCSPPVLRPVNTSCCARSVARVTEEMLSAKLGPMHRIGFMAG